MDRRSSLVALGVLPLVGCAVGAGERAGQTPPVAALAGTRWRVVGLEPEPDAAASWELVEADLTIDADGANAYGSGGCNRWRAGVRSEAPGTIRFDNAASTMMACAAPGFMERESAYLGALAAISSYRRDGDALILEGSGNRIILRAAAP
jgi:heat shock protein HslJ